MTEWMEADVDEPGYEILNDDDIVANIVASANAAREDSSDEEDTADEPKSESQRGIMLWKSIFNGLNRPTQTLVTCSWWMKMQKLGWTL